MFCLYGEYTSTVFNSEHIRSSSSPVPDPEMADIGNGVNLKKKCFQNLNIFLFVQNKCYIHVENYEKQCQIFSCYSDYSDRA